MDFGVFEVASYSPSEGQLRKEAARDKLAAATYDVREKFGSYLFQADSPQGFEDRARLMYADICKTIEPHLHARTGVYSRVLKTLKKEWKQAAQTEDTMAQVTDQSVASSQAGRGGMKPPAPPKVHTHQPQLIGRVACYPGCHDDKAHAEKFHKKDSDSDEKEARRRYADGPPVQQDPDRAHQVLDHTHEVADQHNQKHHQIIDHAHELVDQRAPGTQGLLGAGEGPRGPVGGIGGPDPYGDPMGAQDPYAGDPHGGDPINDLMQSPLGQHFQEQGPSFGRPVEEPLGHNPTSNPFHQGYRYAEFEDQPDHPEQHIQETFQDHQGDELKPEGNWDGYRDRVDQGGPEKVDNNAFIPGAHDHEYNKSDSDNFVPRVTGSRTFQALSRLIEADGPAGMGSGVASLPPSGMPGAGGGMAGAPAGAPPMPTGAGAGAQPMATPPSPGTTGPAAGAGAPVTASYYNQISAMLRQSAPIGGGGLAPQVPFDPAQPGPSAGLGAPEAGAGSRGKSFSNVPGLGDFGVAGAAGQDANTGPRLGSKWAHRMIQEVGTKEARVRLLAVCRSHGVLNDKTAARIHTLLTKKVADSNYLQKADEALTKVLNEKAEEFQNTIAPLQQALITIQQAEQLANPLNVSPPAGTVNVLPGQQQPGGGAAMDASGGGVGMGADPAAAGLAGQPATQPMQQQARRKRGGNPKGSRLS